MTVPLVRFFRRRSVPRKDYARLRGYWDEVGQDLLRNIKVYTNLGWKRNTVRVHVHPKSKTGILGWIEPAEPYAIRVHLSRDNRVNMSTMAHELVHSDVWSNYMEDSRWKEMRLFEDIFADELLTEVIGQKVYIRTNIGGRRQINYSWAIKYGFVTTFQRVADIIGLEVPENVERK